MLPARRTEHRQPRLTEDLIQAARLCARAPYTLPLDPAQDAYLRNLALSMGAPRSEITGHIAGVCGAIGDVGGSEWYERLRQEEDRFLDETPARTQEPMLRSRASYGGRVARSRAGAPGAAATRNRGASAAAQPPAYTRYMPMQRQSPNATGNFSHAPTQFGGPTPIGAWPSVGVPTSLAPARPTLATPPQFGASTYPHRARGSR